MLGSSGFKIAAGVVAWMTGITLLRYKPWRPPEDAHSAGRTTLTVGFLPVT